MKRVAVFDYDNTLILGDSFWPFLNFAVGTLRSYSALACGLISYALRRDRHISLRDFLKDYLVQRLLKGRKIIDLAPAAEKLRRWQKINPPLMRALREHKQRGDLIVIASGALGIYLPDLMHDAPHDALICTDIGFADGIVTGNMINGNCVREIKAQRVAAWLEAHGPFDETFGYGNYPHDVPMLSLVKHRIIVS